MTKYALTEIDLSKAVKRECPGIEEGPRYRAQIGGELFEGHFQRIWLGWNFDGWDAPLQFDAPGSNASRWQKLWRMDPVEDIPLMARAAGLVGL